MRVRCTFCGADYDAPVTRAALVLVARCDRCRRQRLQPADDVAPSPRDRPNEDRRSAERAIPGDSPAKEAITVEHTIPDRQTTLPDQQTTCESVLDTGHAGRFSTGVEALPPTPDKLHRGKYSEGLEQHPMSPENRHPGRFSDGVEQLPETPAKVRRGSFADVTPHEDA